MVVADGGAVGRGAHEIEASHASIFVPVIAGATTTDHVAPFHCSISG